MNNFITVYLTEIQLKKREKLIFKEKNNFKKSFNPGKRNCSEGLPTYCRNYFGFGNQHFLVFPSVSAYGKPRHIICSYYPPILTYHIPAVETKSKLCYLCTHFLICKNIKMVYRAIKMLC